MVEALTEVEEREVAVMEEGGKEVVKEVEALVVVKVGEAKEAAD